MALVAGSGWRTVLAGALAGAGAHAAVATAMLRRRAVRPDEWMVTPYGAIPKLGRRPAPLPSRGWISLVMAGILVRLSCALLCRILMPEDASAHAGESSPWALLYRWNILLAWMHPLPALPMDGSRVLRAWAGFLPPAMTASILRRAGLTCAFVLLFISLVGELHLPALITALFLWHAAETAARPEGVSMPGAASQPGWNPDEIVVSPPPYASATSAAEPANAPSRFLNFDRIKRSLAGWWVD